MHTGDPTPYTSCQEWREHDFFARSVLSNDQAIAQPPPHHSLYTNVLTVKGISDNVQLNFMCVCTKSADCLACSYATRRSPLVGWTISSCNPTSGHAAPCFLPNEVAMPPPTMTAKKQTARPPTPHAPIRTYRLRTSLASC